MISRHFRSWLTGWLLLALSGWAASAPKRPNLVLVMADDLGWGDVAYNGNTRVQTPVLDRMAREGIRLDRFYAGAPVCTPTRATCMTGRNPNRYGTLWAGNYPLPSGEITIAEVLRDAGYRTGHFGKWHLGKMTPKADEGFPGEKKPPTTYMPPWRQGFETCFSTESATPNYNPLVWDGEWDLRTNKPDVNKFIMDRPLVYGEGTIVGKPMARWPYQFWLGEGQLAPEPIAGDSSELIMNRAIPFIQESVRAARPFLAVVWFVTPHTPVAAGPEFRAKYAKLTMREQHWFGAITAMDAQIGRLLDELKKLHVDQDTLVWFCSDNGPSWVHELNSAGPLRGKKSELFEGGIRVPAIVRWPAGLKGGRIIDQPVSTLDFLPTLIAASGIRAPKLPPIDGENVLPLLKADTRRRERPIFFDYPYRDVGGITWVPTDTHQAAVIDGPWKLISIDDRKHFQLYNLEQDIGEKTDIAAGHPSEVKRLGQALEKWTAECAASLKGADYR